MLKIERYRDPIDVDISKFGEDRNAEGSCPDLDRRSDWLGGAIFHLFLGGCGEKEMGKRRRIGGGFERYEQKMESG